MEFRVDGGLLEKIKVHRQDAPRLIQKWKLDRFMNVQVGANHPQYLDANETVFFGRELESFAKRAYNIIYPAYLNTFFVPVNSDGDTGADAHTYESYDSTGEANIIEDEASDYQRSEIKKDETTAPYRTIGQYCQWNLQELRRWTFAARSGLTSGGKSISQRKVEAVTLSIAQKQERIVAEGDSKFGLKGFFGSTDIPSYSFAADSTTNKNDWEGKDALKIAADVFGLISQVHEDSLGAHAVNTVIMGLKDLRILATTRVPNTNVTLISYLKKALSEAGQPVDFYGYTRINQGISDTANTRVLAYEKDPRNIQQMISQPLEILSPQQVGTAFKVFARKRHGGCEFRYAKSAARAEHLLEG